MVNERRLAVSLVALMVALIVGKCAATLAEVWEPLDFIQAPHKAESDAMGGLPWAMINANNVNFRKGPGLNYDVVCQWSYGAAVEVISEENGWCKCFHWTCPDPVWIWGEYLDFK